MTQSSLKRLEDQRLRSAAKEYRDQGYDVIVRPEKAKLPAFLTDCKVDLLAVNGEEHAVVQVKAGPSLSASHDLARLAAVLQDRPGWRLDLVVTNTKDKNGYEEEGAVQLLSEEEVEERFRQVEELLEQKQEVLAMLLAWTATEACLRLIAQYHEVKLKEQSPAYIIKQLFSVGILDRQQYDLLEAAVRSRNTIVHGFRMNRMQPHIIRNLVVSGRDLLRSKPLQHA